MSRELYRRVFLVFFLIMVGLSMVHGVLIEEGEGGASGLLIGMGLGVAAALLCSVDSRIMGKRVVHAFLWLTIIVWPITGPGYLIWSRGLKGLKIAILLFVAMVASGLVSILITHWILYGDPFY